MIRLRIFQENEFVTILEIKKNFFEEETLIEKIYLFHVIIIIENSKRGEKKFLSYERDESKMEK